ncbi:MAG: zinc ribbon domain-containing protein [Candidatus Caldarchaeum sp.]
MASFVRLAAGALVSLAIILLLSTVELSFPQPLQAVVISLVLTAVASGFVAGSAATAAAGTFIGGFAALVLAILWNVTLWSPSPVPSDMPIIRTLLLGGAAVLAAGVGFVKGSILHKTPVPTEPRKEQSQAVQPQDSSQVTSPLIPESKPTPVVLEVENRICKFCSSVIPAESVYCPMCGAKLVEEE